jgi:hypothetical protein
VQQGMDLANADHSVLLVVRDPIPKGVRVTVTVCAALLLWVMGAGFVVGVGN